MPGASVELTVDEVMSVVLIEIVVEVVVRLVVVLLEAVVVVETPPASETMSRNTADYASLLKKSIFRLFTI